MKSLFGSQLGGTSFLPEKGEKKTMPIEVYVWLPYGDYVGHASMKLSDGTYISWWPGNKDLKKKSNMKAALISPAVLRQSLEEDIELEGYITPRNYTLPDGFIDEDAIINWWESFSANVVYRELDQNCCHVVFRALQLGGAWNLITDGYMISGEKLLLHPGVIDTLVTKLEKSLQDKKT